MELFVEYLDGPFAVCRLPDRDGNLIRLPLRVLPAGVKALDVVVERENGSFYVDPYGAERRRDRLLLELNYKRYHFRRYTH